MNLEQLLRQENYHLKNEITQLKNVLDINRDILRLISLEQYKKDPTHQLLLQIITKLTSINNEAMTTNLRLIQERNFLKEEIFRLNLELDRLQQRFSTQLSNNKNKTSPTESSLFVNENDTKQRNLSYGQQNIKNRFKSISLKDIMMHQSQQIINFPVEENMNAMSQAIIISKQRIEQTLRMEEILREEKKQVIFLRKYIQQLENRLLLFIKGHQFEQQKKYISQQKEMSQLLKYALKEIKVFRKNNRWVKKVTSKINQEMEQELRHNQSHSWPKHKQYCCNKSPQK